MQFNLLFKKFLPGKLALQTFCMSTMLLQMKQPVFLHYSSFMVNKCPQNWLCFTYLKAWSLLMMRILLSSQALPEQNEDLHWSKMILVWQCLLTLFQNIGIGWNSLHVPKLPQKFNKPVSIRRKPGGQTYLVTYLVMKDLDCCISLKESLVGRCNSFL